MAFFQDITPIGWQFLDKRGTFAKLRDVFAGHSGRV